MLFLEGESIGKTGIITIEMPCARRECAGSRMEDTHFAGPDLGNIVGTRCEFISELVHPLGTFLVAHSRPRAIVESIARSGDGAIDIGFLRARDLEIELLRSRSKDIDQCIGRRIDPLARDEDALWLC